MLSRSRWSRSIYQRGGIYPTMVISRSVAGWQPSVPVPRPSLTRDGLCGCCWDVSDLSADFILFYAFFILLCMDDKIIWSKLPSIIRRCGVLRRVRFVREVRLGIMWKISLLVIWFMKYIIWNLMIVHIMNVLEELIWFLYVKSFECFESWLWNIFSVCKKVQLQTSMMMKNRN